MFEKWLFFDTNMLFMNRKDLLFVCCWLITKVLLLLVVVQSWCRWYGSWFVVAVVKLLTTNIIIIIIILLLVRILSIVKKGRWKDSWNKNTYVQNWYIQLAEIPVQDWVLYGKLAKGRTKSFCTADKTCAYNNFVRLGRKKSSVLYERQFPYSTPYTVSIGLIHNIYIYNNNNILYNNINRTVPGTGTSTVVSPNLSDENRFQRSKYRPIYREIVIKYLWNIFFSSMYLFEFVQNTRSTSFFWKKGTSCTFVSRQLTREVHKGTLV